MLDELTNDTFVMHLNKVFRMSTSEDAVDVKLISVDRLAPRPSGKRQPFSLVFRGPMAPVWPQRIYLLARDGLGELDVFLVPIGPDELGMRYEAVFG